MYTMFVKGSSQTNTGERWTKSHSSEASEIYTA